MRARLNLSNEKVTCDVREIPDLQLWDLDQRMR
jgi:hypothetical protein